MKNIVILTLILLSLHSYSQNLNYKITSNKTDIGILHVKKITKNDTTQIEVTSSAKFKLFISVDLTYKLNSTYVNNILQYSSTKTYVNGKVHSTTITKKTGNYYTITQNGHTSKYFQTITYSGSLLYFFEPKKTTKIYSEFGGIIKPIKKIGNHTYQITNPKNNHLSEFYYQNGILETSTIHHKLITFTLSKI